MEFAKGKTYKLIEVPTGMVIVDMNDNRLGNGKGHHPLCLADGNKLANYLCCYIYQREQGDDLKTAHAKACHYIGAPILPKKELHNNMVHGDIEKPDGFR